MKNHEVFPDEIFMDARNLPRFDDNQFEGRMEKSIPRRTILFIGLLFLFFGLFFVSRAWALQISKGEVYAKISENNRLNNDIVFAERGTIVDRNDVLLAWNTPREGELFNTRVYTTTSGFSQLLGYISYPKKDKKGIYFDHELKGKTGSEQYYDYILQGKNGIKITETDALGKVVSENVLEPAEHGETLKLSVDSRIQAKLYEYMEKLSDDIGFSGGAAAIMNVHTGELVAFTSYPEFSSSVMTEGSDSAKIKEYFNDPRNLFLSRLNHGLYTPGSIVKPYVALGALEEGTISPDKIIVSTGKIEVVNPYNPSQSTAFNDWKAHGPVDMRKAIALSSNVYFYEIGGGFADIKGLGITKLDKYYRLFGFGSPLVGFFEGKSGTVPNPEWKKKHFDGDDWRLGDTYFTSIGQYGFQATPMQALRAVSAIANGGKLIDPTILRVASSTVASSTDLGVNPGNLKIIREGMRQGALIGTAKALNVPYVEIAGKTGTAELGTTKAKVNSWNEGFWPYDNPKYAFVVMMEQGPRSNTVGAVFVMRQLVDWMNINTPEYFDN